LTTSTKYNHINQTLSQKITQKVNRFRGRDATCVRITRDLLK
jgi:hypothetical protein